MGARADAALRHAAELYAALGWAIEFVPGWQDRGKGAWWPSDGWTWHHTAGSQRGGLTASLRTVTFGRPGLRNALCNTYRDRHPTQPTRYVVAADTAWHAGRGRHGTNPTLGGDELENDGVGETWTTAQYRSDVDWAACCSIAFGIPVDDHRDHKEHAPSRKIDRAGIHPPTFRADVARRIPEIIRQLSKHDQEDPDMPFLAQATSDGKRTGPVYLIVGDRAIGVPDKPRLAAAQKVHGDHPKASKDGIVEVDPAYLQLYGVASS